MIFLVQGVSHELKEEYCLAMLQDNINNSRLIVHAQQVEETIVKRKRRQENRARSIGGCSSMGRL